MAIPLAAGDPPGDAARADFEWFSGLGYPDVKAAKWAEVWDGRSWQPDSKPLQAITTHGFILDDKQDSFHVLMPDLSRRWLRKTAGNESDPKWVGFKERPLSDSARLTLAELRHPPKRGFERYAKMVGHSAEVFFIAYACWCKGENELAQELYDEAGKLPITADCRGEMVGANPPMRDLLEIELGKGAMWTAMLQVGGTYDSAPGSPLATRTELLESFRRIVKNYPISSHCQQAKDMIALLEKMVREDERHRVLTNDELAKLPEAERLAELIFRLRDQNGQPMGNRLCDILGPTQNADSPAHQLVAMGYPAVPQLIDAVGDDRLSRSLRDRDYRSMPSAMTVGDCALQILERISGESFSARTSLADARTRWDKISAEQRLPRQWWEEYQQKGERQMLIDAIASGEKSPNRLVAKLKATAPDAVEDAVLRGAANVKDRSLTFAYIEMVGSLHSTAASTQLLAWMNGPAELQVRLAAATQLSNQDHPYALPGIIREWRAYSPPKDKHDTSTFEELVKLLIANGGPEAMGELVKNWDRRPDTERFYIVREFGWSLWTDAGRLYSPWFATHPPTEEAKELAIELLAHALEDKSAWFGQSGSYGDFTFINLRIRDLALWALHQIEPSRYRLTPKAGRRLRDLECIVAANVWRTAHGKKALPLPTNPAPKPDEKHALKITLIDVYPPEKLAGSDFAKKIAGLRNADFAPDTIPKLLTWFATHDIPDVSEIHIDAVRENDLTGVTLIVGVTSGTYPLDQQYQWHMRQSGKIGDRYLETTTASCRFPYPKNDKFWGDAIEDVAEVTTIPPTTSFAISAGMTGTR